MLIDDIDRYIVYRRMRPIYSWWVAFSSKRQGGSFTRTYLCCVVEDGKSHEPFVLPQHDPAHYDSLLETYSVPELARSRVKAGKTSLARAARATASGVIDVPVTGATPKAGTTSPRQERE